MTAKQRLTTAVARRLARRGFEVRRHPAARRAAVLARHGVDLVVDVGAADGGYGHELRAFGYTGDIVSFEPRADAYAALRIAVDADPRWDARQVALGPEPGEMSIHVSSNGTSSSLLPMLDRHREAAPWVEVVEDVQIRVERLDDEVADQVEGRRSMLKIDTQGFERQVLAGGPRTLAAVTALQLELSLVPLYEGGMLIDEAISMAYDHGFQMVGVEQGYAAPTGEILQVDGVFVRPPEASVR